MAQFSANTGSMRQNAADIRRAAVQLITLEAQLSSVREKLDSHAAGTAVIKKRLQAVSGSLLDERSRLTALQSALEQACVLYEKGEDAILCRQAAPAAVAKAGVPAEGLGLLLGESMAGLSGVVSKPTWESLLKTYKETKALLEGNKPLISREWAGRSVQSASSGSLLNDQINYTLETGVAQADSTFDVSLTKAHLAFGGSVTALTLSASADSILGHTEANVEIMKAEADGEILIDPTAGNMYASGNLGVYAGKATVSHKGSMLGIAYEAEVSAVAGVGISGEIGIKDGKLTLSGGVSAVLGAEASITIDLKQTAQNFANAAQEGVKAAAGLAKSAGDAVADGAQAIWKGITSWW